MTISIRVRSKTDSNAFRIVSVDTIGLQVHCDCVGFNGLICSHIDAVLVAQERAMVHPEDFAIADKAINLVGSHISIPSQWKGSWRNDLRWRGLSRLSSSRRVRDSQKPLVCFTGTLARPRAELSSQAKNAGWETIDSPSRYTTVLVAADPLGTSGKLKAARKHATPIVTLEQWDNLIHDGVLPE